MTGQYRQPSDLPARIPVFPLRGAILLPHATLPLNIFEPRYLQMVDDVMSGERVIGVIQPKLPGGDGEQESPIGKEFELQRVGCVGRVTTYQEMEDERVMITLSGVSRFEVVGEPASDTPYRLVTTKYDSYVTDFTVGLGEAQVDREKLLGVLKDYLDANNLSADWEGIRRASSEQLINALSVMSPFGAEEKQALLEAPTLSARADVLVALAEMELAAGVGGAGTLQ